MDNLEVLLTLNTKEIGPRIFANEISQTSERSLVFDLGNGVAMLVTRPGGDFGLCIVTTDVAGVPYGCWFDSTPDFPLISVSDTEKDEQLLLNLLFGQAFLGDRRLLPISRKSIIKDGEVVSWSNPNPEYWIRDALHIQAMVEQEAIRDVVRGQPGSEWFFNTIDMSKQVSQLAKNLSQVMTDQVQAVTPYLDSTQLRSTELLLEAIPQIVDNAYKESDNNFDINVLYRSLLFHPDD
jgi:hypothetical protein